MMEDRFNNAVKHVSEIEENRSSIGRLGEKTLHKILKYFFEPEDAFHEVKIGRYHADIANDDEIIEIQTRSFNALRAKLTFFLEQKPVRIVYPMVNRKHLVWIDPETGETSSRRKSPKIGKPLDCFYELYKIKPLLDNKNLRLTIVFLDVVDYRNLNGYSRDRKRGSSRYERIPEKFISIIEINCREDYGVFLSNDLPDVFTSKDIQKQEKVALRNVQAALNVLYHLGVVEKVGKSGNTILYKKT